ncbi:hypothetical protein G3I60_30155 [Streptomyces sp. SID13666]|uniref:hypothetical protein n=1 Tax=unclassified Streptomyces TaxID=2593676 RepID=UPI0013C0D6C5|nr:MULTISPECIES: hypothetical protein [unclassified Streptomyces]NEA58305.1 hypothetical protein [Streptomyces sp. SID13666]NEA76567.1 hypothetical protein [Streptomyces sp. SID13588]
MVGQPVGPVSEWTTDLIVGDASVNTCRAYCYGLLTWFRVLWTTDAAVGNRVYLLLADRAGGRAAPAA